MSEIPPYRPDPLAPGFTPAAESAPDSGHDHHVSFPDQPTTAPTNPPVAPVASQSAPPSGMPARSYPSYQGNSQQPGWHGNAGSGPSFQPPGAPPGRRPSRVRTLVLAAVFFVVVPLVVVGLVVGNRSDRSTDPSPRAARPTTVPNSPLSVDPTPVPRLTPDVRSVRFEVQGTGRADIRIYRNGASQRIKDVTLPYAVSVPVGDDRSPYISVDATDYERTDSMKCIATAGAEVVAVNVGTRRVECTVTSSSLPTSGDKL
ncbi:hypothetical protein [Humibacillus sp. DSM 29435]|uniref:hypothetical protein n=1 Tax=Humibacillus sp. DSM 29435 TaxID=1869167 RepID=UPI00111312B9|nr:hypothetical protein [Humibacillus sp. DSM 29435]